MTDCRFAILVCLIVVAGLGSHAGAVPAAAFVNGLDMRMVPVPAGTFEMGGDGGDYDERPGHAVTVTTPFWMAATEVTNAQYERFRPEHRDQRGGAGDDEAVVCVSWDDATAFCAWLSEKEGATYRLPTEAEWEYACRAGGDDGPLKEFVRDAPANVWSGWGPSGASKQVAATRPNAWGLFDLHGNAEEWCRDWYGPYAAGPQTDPAGPADGQFRVTRGGANGFAAAYLRCANRAGYPPDNGAPSVGFRVVRGDLPADPDVAPAAPAARWARDVSQERFDWPAAKDAPVFLPPIDFMRMPPGNAGPLYDEHDHCPDVVACPNGDLLATWYTTTEEPSPKLAVAAARLRRGAEQWDEPDLFYKVPDRNMHATAVWWDGGETLYHIQGVSVARGWSNLAILCRTSTDNGATWSRPTWIDRRHVQGSPIAGMKQFKDGRLFFARDFVPGGDGGSAVFVSDDAGQTWHDPAGDAKMPPTGFAAGASGPRIAGIHAGVVELRDGRLMALGRGDAIDGHMPQSLSDDGGKTWTYAASAFPPIGGGQRLVLRRLDEGPLLLVSFTGIDSKPAMTFPAADGSTFDGHGLFAAVSYDDGRTWPVRKLLTPGGGEYHSRGWTGTWTADATHAEPKGYLAATQTPDHMIHLLSSGLHYRFNLAWLAAPPEDRP